MPSLFMFPIEWKKNIAVAKKVSRKARSTEFQNILRQIIFSRVLNGPEQYLAMVYLQQKTSKTTSIRRQIPNTTVKMLIKILVPKNFFTRPLDGGSSSSSAIF